MKPFHTFVSSLTVIALFGTMCLPGRAEEAPSLSASPRESFERALPLLEASDFRGARPLLEEALAGAPEEPAVLWNLGLVYAELGEHEQALAIWQKVAALEPANWQVTAKIVQACQGLQRPTERDAAIKRLLEQRKKDKDAQRRQQPWFCREQFRVNGQKFLAIEYFEPKKPNRVFVAFLALQDDGTEAFRFSLGSYDATTEVARSTGQIGPMGRLYHLDYYASGGHRTYGFFPKQPTYDAIRERVVAILTSEVPPLSSTTAPPAQPPAPPEATTDP